MKHTLLLGASPVPLVSRPSSLCVTHLIGVAFKSCTEMPFLTVGRVEVEVSELRMGKGKENGKKRMRTEDIKVECLLMGKRGCILPVCFCWFFTFLLL